jgi:hypothetical protein
MRFSSTKPVILPCEKQQKAARKAYYEVYYAWFVFRSPGHYLDDDPFESSPTPFPGSSPALTSALVDA